MINNGDENGIIIVYWVWWIYLTLVTFFMKKSSLRNSLAILLFLLLIFGNYIITWKQISVNTAVLILFIASSLFLTRSKRRISLFVVCLFVAHVYAGLRCFEVVTPVWFFLPKTLLYGGIFVVIISFLSKKLIDKLIIVCLSIIIGEAIFMATVYSINWNIIIGAPDLLLLLTVLSAIILCHHLGMEIKRKLQDILHVIEQQNKRWTNE
ncbi:YphA family membrane protein [Paraliobacillus ryukyuensis]|uniref:YphA family membrane protein n=1 Tax=Paraliobacillus ryukyuensis TaxID=200904 RepID=UPI003F8C1C1F